MQNLTVIIENGYLHIFKKIKTKKLKVQKEKCWSIENLLFKKYLSALENFNNIVELSKKKKEV